MPHTQKINLKYMWLHALGLNAQKVDEKLKRNEGVWAPDGGPCKVKDMHLRKGCTSQRVLSLGRDESDKLFYSWAKRNKESYFKVNLFC